MNDLNYQAILAAHERIQSKILRTPLDPSFALPREDGHRYFFKLECYQTARSFKIRGALNKMMLLSEAERTCGVATISSGNHGASVSYAAHLLGISPALVIVPETTPESKIQKIEFFGANVLKIGQNYDEAHAQGMRYIQENHVTYIDPYYKDPAIYAGQGTIGLEILQQNPEIDTIVVPIGGGGLITGIATAAKAIRSDIRMIGVQTEACPAMARALEDHVFYEDFPSSASLCDALIGGIGKRAYDMASQCIDDVLTVSENSIRYATAFLLQKEKIMAEPSSATVVAAIQQYPERIGGKTIAAVISGGNISEHLLYEILCENRLF